MATRGKTTFQKRQKEMARKEKQHMKEARRAQRKLAQASGERIEPEEAGFAPEAEQGQEQLERE